MNVKAKVKLDAVKLFMNAATGALEYSEKFNRGIACFEQMSNYILKLEEESNEEVAMMKAARERLAVKISIIEENIARLTVKINEMRNHLRELEYKLSEMPSFVKEMNEEGEECEIVNSEYTEFETEISNLKDEVNILENELYSYQKKEEIAKGVDKKILCNIEAYNGALYSLKEKNAACIRLKAELENIKAANLKKCTYAVENLKKIEQIVTRYLKIKMVYDNNLHLINYPSLSNNNIINVYSPSITINKTNVSNANETEQTQVEKEDIDKHNIKFDENNHICEYDGKKYGGQYSEYKERIDRTPSEENIIRGEYIGIRGESKYVPSNKSAEGIKIIEILVAYGLDGIEYRNGEPDFEACAEAVVSIEAMTEYRYKNFSQADIELSNQWNSDKKEGRSDWTPRDVLNYRADNGLTWHEKCDTKTMVLVKNEINTYFTHLGGCSECRLRDAAKNGEVKFDE